MLLYLDCDRQRLATRVRASTVDIHLYCTYPLYTRRFVQFILKISESFACAGIVIHVQCRNVLSRQCSTVLRCCTTYCTLHYSTMHIARAHAPC